MKKKGTRSKHRHCPFATKVQKGGKDYKTSVMWLFQESESVFRSLISNKEQTTICKWISIPHSTVKQSSYCEEVSILGGDICVFEEDGNWKARKILQFSHHNEKTKGAQQYCGLVAKVSATTTRLGILCSLHGR